MRKILSVFIALLFVAPLGAHAAVNASALENLINVERARAGLSAVTQNPKLTQAAQMKADDMAARGYFEHIGPDGRDPWSWFAIVGYKWDWAGEILAMNANTESETAIVDAWMNSPEHKKIIMDSRYTEVGFGIAVGTYQGQRVVFVAGEFGLPKATAAAQIAVPAPTPVQQPAAQIEPTQIIQQTQPAAQAQSASVQSAVKTVAKVASKPVEAVVKKAEAKEIVQATTTATVETTVETATSTALRTVEHPVIAKASFLTRIRLFFTGLLKKWA